MEKENCQSTFFGFLKSSQFSLFLKKIGPKFIIILLPVMEEGSLEDGAKDEEIIGMNNHLTKLHYILQLLQLLRYTETKQNLE